MAEAEQGTPQGTPEGTPQAWENKIVGHGSEDPEQLVANPKNWRIHPGRQQRILRSAIGEVGFVRSVTVNRTTGFVLDGHLRVLLALREGIPEVPVEYVELDENEEAAALASLDPVGAMAATDAETYDNLLGEISVGDAELNKWLAETRDNLAPPNAPDEFREFGEDLETQHTCPRCQYTWG